MKLYNFCDDADFNALKAKMGADGYGHFVEFDPEHQLTFGERDLLAKDELHISPGSLRILKDHTLALKNSRVWVQGGSTVHVASCETLHQLRNDMELRVSTRDPGKDLAICPDCLAELNYLGLDGRKSRRLSDHLNELFSMTQFQQDYPVYPIPSGPKGGA